MRRVLLIVGILLIPIIPIVLVITGAIQTKPQTAKPVTLTVWGTEDEQKILAPLILNYRVTRSYAKITYRQVRSEDYLDRLKSAWAQGTGPDVFFVPSSWVGQMTDFAVPMPAQLGVPLVRTGQGLFRSSTQIVNQALPAPSIASLQNSYVDAVTSDVIRGDQVWGLPLSMDTLVVYYNKDLLNNSKIFEPASTWGELVSQIESNKLTVTDQQGNLVQSGVALGTFDNIPNAATLIKLLLQQNGVAEANTGGAAHLQEDSAQAALEFYLSFSNPRKVSYSWNANQPNARDAFLGGKLAYYFGTLDDRAIIEAGSVNWGVTPMFHLSDQGDRDAASGQTRLIDAATYSVMMVSKASGLQKRSLNAWNFLYYLTRPQVVPAYLQSTGQLAALKSILNTQKDDPTLGQYAGQLLTSRSWYHGTGGDQVDQFLRDLVTSVVTGQTTLPDALRLANEQIGATL